MISANGKIWGTTYPLFNKNNVEIHRLEINKGAYCSKHHHEHKFNMFCVEKGKLEINIFKKYKLATTGEIKEGVDTTILTTKMATTVDPLEDHQFKALENTILYEIYWVELDEDDIVRKNMGGKDG